MDYTKEADSTMFYLKFLQALMVCDNMREFLEEAKELGIHYTSIAVLQTFKEIVDAYTSSWSLPSNISRNVIDYVSVCRFRSDEETKEETAKRFDVCNDIINAINSSQGKPLYPFYTTIINQVYHGFVSKALNHIAYARNPEWMEEFLNSLLSLEYYVLYSHSHLLQDSEFMEFGCSFLLNGTYLEAVDFLLRDIPELSNDPIFLRRIRKVLTENENLLSEYNGNPIDGSDSYLEDDDTEFVADKDFWKLHDKVKKKVERYQKDS